jgi:flagellar basal-body rod protein FlgF
MENSLLIGLSRQMTLRREMDTIANNIANVNTAGFRSDRSIFQEHLMPVARADGFTRAADRRLSYVIDPGTATSFQPGTVDRTGADFDLALQGDGFFVVQTPQGERYTRAGNFQVNGLGQLVTPAGHQVLSEGGPIVFTNDDGRVSIAPDGTISTAQGSRGRVRVVTFANPALLKKEGDTEFSANGAQPTAAPVSTRIMQGMLERSNVQPVVEIGRLIEVNRAYQLVSQMVERTQDLRRSAIERLAQLP